MSYNDDALSRSVIEAVICVHRTLGPGFLEGIYRNALALELTKRGHRVEREKEIRIYYDDVEIGLHRLDFLIDGELVLEMKTVEELSHAHYAQLRSYLRAANKPVGLLVNMAQSKSDFRRVENNMNRDEPK